VIAVGDREAVVAQEEDVTVMAAVSGGGVDVNETFGTNARYVAVWLPIIHRLQLVWAPRFHTGVVFRTAEFPPIIAELRALSQALEDAGQTADAEKATRVADGMVKASTSAEASVSFG
jgi:hypothetical protein